MEMPASPQPESRTRPAVALCATCLRSKKDHFRVGGDLTEIDGVYSVAGSRVRAVLITKETNSICCIGRGPSVLVVLSAYFSSIVICVALCLIGASLPPAWLRDSKKNLWSLGVSFLFSWACRQGVVLKYSFQRGLATDYSRQRTYCSSDGPPVGPLSWCGGARWMAAGYGSVQEAAG